MSRSKFFYWSSLVRLPNTTTVIADVLAGWILAVATWDQPVAIALVVLAIVMLYWSGMIWNDVADVEQDRQQRANRPIVSGNISLDAAIRLGILTLAIGLICSFVISISCGIVAGALAACMLSYDCLAKKTWLAPWLMGACRSLSIFLGVMAAGWWDQTAVSNVPSQAIACAVIGHGIYVAGFTLAGRREAGQPQRSDLIFGWLICAIGVAMLAGVDWVANSEVQLSLTRRIHSNVGYPILIGLLALPLFRRAIHSIQTLAGLDIQASIKQAILTIIFFDAAIALQFGSTVQAIVICFLIVPTLLLGRWFYST